MTAPLRTPRADRRPLFIVGCVRSGTTLTRDLLRRVPAFICPEETHFFRWADAFRTPQNAARFGPNKVLERHRELDGVSERDYRQILRISHSKADLQVRYITLFARSKGITEPYRWFDKTPQNIYGAALMAQEFPRATFLHLVRNPLNVVASLIAGRQVRVSDLHGACNYWVEAVQIARTLKAAHPRRVMELRYEDLIADPPKELDRILRFAQVPHPEGLFSAGDARPERNLWRRDLTRDQAAMVVQRCDRLAQAYGYDLAGQLAARKDCEAQDMSAS